MASCACTSIPLSWQLRDPHAQSGVGRGVALAVLDFLRQRFGAPVQLVERLHLVASGKQGEFFRIGGAYFAQAFLDDDLPGGELVARFWLAVDNRTADEEGIAMVLPDTSPRGDGVADDDAYVARRAGARWGSPGG